MVKKTETVVPEALRLKTCTQLVRNGSSKEKCGKQYIAKVGCKQVHLLPLVTGFCSNGWCEGTKAKDWRGRPVPTCTFVNTCPCACHDTLAKLFEISGQDRVVVESSGYSPPERTYWLPSDEPATVLSSPDDTTGVVLVESPLPDRVPARTDRAFTPTPSGRAARGELEAWVRQECDAWLVDESEDLCTPANLAKWIGREQGITPPSVGAISAVLERWSKLGFAVFEKKPSRFVGYTEDGVRLGLEQIKANAKREEKLRRANIKRGFR